MAVFSPRGNVVQNQALMFAVIAHGSQVRKGNEHIPYVFHCVDTANEVIHYSGLPTQELETASVIALLHDTIEDTAVTVVDLHHQFGEVVADGVAALSKGGLITEESEFSKLKQLQEGLVRIKAQPRFVWAVKLADRISNLKVFPAMWGREKIANYLDESALIAAELGEASEGLRARLLSRIVDARVMLSLLN